MARKAFLLVMALIPAVGACASAPPPPVMMARIDAAIPPMPAELAGATNGKADPPFQVEAALVLAAEIQRDATAVRTARAEPGEWERASQRPATPVSVKLARVATPSDPAHPSHGAPAPPATVSPLDPMVSAKAAGGVSYADLVRIDADASSTSPAASAQHLAVTPPRRRVQTRRSTRVLYASSASTASITRTVRLDTFVHLPASPHAYALQSRTERAPHRATPPIPMMVHIRTLVVGWLRALRV